MIGSIIGFGARALFGTAVRRGVTGLVGTGVAGTIAAKAVEERLMGGPTPPPRGAERQMRQGGAMAPQPVEGPVGAFVSRMLPGGLTGREWRPVEGVEKDKYGRPIAVYPAKAERMVAPSGYVIVYPFPSGNDRGPAVAMLKGAARAMGLWSAKPKPVISGYDTRAIQRAHRAKKRVAKLAKKVAKC